MDEAVSSDSIDVSFLCEDSQVEPRVGDEYQAQIPQLISKSERTMLVQYSVASEVTTGASHFIQSGLCIPITWIKNGDDIQGSEDDKVDINESLQSIKARKSRFCSKNKSQKPENPGTVSEHSKRSKSENYHPVPISPSCSWKDAEVDSFLLGLYIFGKNFVHVRKFMDNKAMEDILAYYFGKFYNTNKYHKWSDSRKTRRRKCVFGRKLFLGWRQHELLSRLIPGVSEEMQKKRLLDVSKSFAEGNISLEKYIYTLKELVGVSSLVNAVGIGKGKKDLTCLAMEPVKTKQWFTVSSNQPAAKTYGSLTSSDIIKQLTDGSRLSKARCNDIFWEAVWPRLLARGWRSEQPKNEGYVTSKDYLVFLVPGVKKFSRSKLVKGEHYYDSVSDILTKVASKPELLEFETGDLKAASLDAENLSDQSDQDSPSNIQSRHHYLRAPVSNHNSMHMKFTVVDTSGVATGGKLCSLKELKFAAKDSHLSAKSSTRIQNGRSVSGVLTKKQTLQKTCDGTREKIGCPEPDIQMRFTVVDTSLEHSGKSSRSQLRKLRHLPVDLSPWVDRLSTERHERSDNAKSRTGAHDNLGPEDGRKSLELGGKTSRSRKVRRLPVDLSPRTDRSLTGSHKTSDNVKSRSSLHDNSGPDDVNHRSANGVPCHVGLDFGKSGEVLVDQRNQETGASNDGRPKKVIRPKFIRRGETDNSVNNAPVPKRRRLSACVKKELSLLNENPSLKLKLNPSRPSTPPYAQDTNHAVHLQESTNQEITMSSKGNPEEGRDRAAKKDDSFDIKENYLNMGERQNRLSIDLNLIPNDANEPRNGQPLEQGMHHVPTNPSDVCSTSDLDNQLDSKEMKSTTNDAGSMEQQRDLDMIPRRQSTRKRPLTTRVLESLEMGLYTPKKQKSSKLRKPQKRSREPATGAQSNVRIIPESLKEAENGEDKSFLVEKAKSSRSFDHKEDEEPKRPPIVLKLSFKRN